MIDLFNYTNLFRTISFHSLFALYTILTTSFPNNHDNMKATNIFMAFVAPVAMALPTSVDGKYSYRPYLRTTFADDIAYAGYEALYALSATPPP